MTAIKIPTSFNIDLEFEAADLGQRFLAWLIDWVVRGVYITIFVLIIGSLTRLFQEPAMMVLFFLVIMLPVVAYPLLFEMFMEGQTPGKLAMSIKVVGLVGNVPTTSQHLVRWFFRIIEQPLFFWAIVPVMSILRSPLNQRLGDVVAGTIVISTKPRGSIEETIFRDLSASGYQPQFPEILRLSDRDMNKIKELLDRALTGDHQLAERVANRVKEVLKITTNLPDTVFLETVLNDYNYYTTVEK
ncbi:RDD family protein [Chitinophaga sp. sic0106]|uniref:RDD family protein n=1 Tax=Chitinophaga sp. sic0106 TaxID=2854785 RepID=UPI001C444E7C|nr:RDD family protein [Chitinophaga sp. sic0106]MBV7533608.1 RDD family protein [Chitinophaga sp. sic0106]